MSVASSHALDRLADELEAGEPQEVEAIDFCDLQLSPPQYWFSMMTCARLMMTRLYAVDKLLMQHCINN